ncbi:MAG: hypothetical protein E7F48_10075, partial [Streptococcus oralis]|nr:hypothetical protein [Streptococcus oralis]
RVVKRFKATFDINVQHDWPIRAIEMATLKRNDLVHRGGKDKDGNLVVVTEQDLNELLGYAIDIGKKIHLSLKIAIQGDDSERSEEF